MASINGVQIKGLKSFKEHEGMNAYQGNVYIDGKKQGFWTQDFSCGADHFYFSTDVLDSRAAAYRAGLPEPCEYREFVNAETMLGDLVCLMEDEKLYKRRFREGFTAMIVVSDGYHVCYFNPRPTFALPHMSKDEIAERYAKGIEEMRGHMWPDEPHCIRIYTSLDDFDLTVDDEHPAPEWLCLWPR